MQWSHDRTQLILCLLLTLSGAAGLVGAFRRVPSSAQARAIRSADLLLYFGIVPLGVASGLQGAPRGLHVVILCLAIVCIATSVLLRRGAAVSFGN